MRIRTFAAGDIRRTVSMTRAIEAMTDVYIRVSSGGAVIPLRTALPLGGGAEDGGVVLFMPASLGKGGGVGAKIVAVVPANRALGLPTIHALVILIDERTGVPEAVLEGTGLTALRTGAASGAATALLARPDARTAAVFGAGIQARTQLEAVCTVRTIEAALVYDLDRQAAETFARDMSAAGPPIPVNIRPAATAAEAAAFADVICTATTSPVPVFPDAALRPGTHINAVGSFKPEVREIPGDTVARAKVVVDSREASLAETGDLIIPIAEGLITAGHIHAELGEIAAGRRPGREAAAEITLFKSVGLAAQDVAVARLVLAEAGRLGLGGILEL